MTLSERIAARDLELRLQAATGDQDATECCGVRMDDPCAPWCDNSRSVDAFVPVWRARLTARDMTDAYGA